MKNTITVTHPIHYDGFERTDIDYYILNGERIATVVRPLKHLHYNGWAIRVEDISKDTIINKLKTLTKL